MYRTLSRVYRPVVGVMPVDRIDVRLFTDTFFHACMECTFCHDKCCQYGATVELPMRDALLARAAELEPIIGRPAAEWFADVFREDADYAGGGYVRTRVYDGRCVFLNRKGRGCLLHGHALAQGTSVHATKPLACNLFPIGWGDGALTVPPEIDERELICLGPGMTLYRSARNDVRYYYGDDLVAELDALEAEVLGGVRARSLPLVS
jgi:Fe-S-cluster containining protein